MLYRGMDKKQFYLASMLYEAIETKHLKWVSSLLIEKRANPNLVLPKKGIAPFHLAIGCHTCDFALEVTNLILQNGGNPNVRSEDDLTPVHIAASWGRVQILELLLKNGGDPEAKDIDRKTPVYYAAKEKFLDCLDLLKGFTPSRNVLIKGENSTSQNGCHLFLNKILVNNGALIGEYGVSTEEASVSSIKPTRDDLHSLPQTDTTELVLNWVSEHVEQNACGIEQSILKDLGSSSTFEYSDESLAESDCDRESKRYDSRYINFRKVYRKKRSKSSNLAKKSKNSSSYDVVIEPSVKVETNELSVQRDYSKESGIMTLPLCTISVGNDSKTKSPDKQDKSSDYFTCSHNSINSFEKNVFEITEDLSGLNEVSASSGNKTTSIKSLDHGSDECSFVSVSEVYKYIDTEEGVVLYEKRLVKTNSECANTIKSSNISSNLSTLPPTFDYDVNTLKKELTLLGFEPGPITASTKRVYLRKLYELKKRTPTLDNHVANPAPRKVYSVELEKTLRTLDWCNDPALKTLEQALINQFTNVDPARKWREGVNKSSFTYLLLDPRITNDLPHRQGSLEPLQTWQTFLSAIFYVGKGKRSRPYQHLYEAVSLWKKQQFSANSKKIHKILDIWRDDSGVICLHVFMNIIPVEAYTREAAMISAIKLDNLTNIKSGEFYGVAATWSQREKKMLGVLLLYKAMMIFLQEGERQLYATDID